MGKLKIEKRIDEAPIPNKGDKMVMLPQFGVVHFESYSGLNQIKELDKRKKETERRDRINHLYKGKLTVHEYKPKVKLSPYFADIVYFDEFPDVPHLAHHFKLV